ncbi:hypothetical protein MBLNU457_5845t1 [Dothideomycetes sp. NU457]
MDAKTSGQVVRDGETQELDSIISGLDSMDDDTDEFGRMVLQHARDEQRMHNALQRSNQPFRKARPTPRIEHALEHRREPEATNGHGRGSPQETSAQNRAPSAASSNESEPPLNVPKDWGRKGKHSSSWLRRMRDPEPEAQTAQSEGEAILPHKTAFTGDDSQVVDWLAAGDSPISARRRRHGSSPEILQKQSMLREKTVSWDVEQDLTAASLLASTPAVPSRSRPADEYRRREIESIQHQAITTSRLERFSTERTSSDRVRQRLSGRLSRSPHEAVRPKNSPDLRQPRHDLSHNKENVPLSQQADSITKGLDTAAAANDAVRASAQKTRADAQALLRRLARASSKSPSPAPEPRNTINEKIHVSEGIESRLRASSAHAPEAITIDNGPFILEATPMPNRAHEAPAKTPVVTGAWVDTPGPRIESRASAHTTGPNTLYIPTNPTQEPQELSPQIGTLKRSRSAPAGPSSALTDLLHTARVNHTTAEYGDDTIASLEDLLDPTLRNLDPTLELDNDNDALQAELDHLQSTGRPASTADRDRENELRTIADMNKRLRTARLGIRDAKTGLKKFERDIDRATAASHEQSHSQTGALTCAACGHVVNQSVISTMLHEVTSWFIERDNGTTQLTPLSWTLFMLLMWFLAETALCTIVSPPMYAETMSGYGVDADAPRFPFALPTVILRPFKFLWWPVVKILGWVFGGLGSYLLEFMGLQGLASRVASVGSTWNNVGQSNAGATDPARLNAVLRRYGHLSHILEQNNRVAEDSVRNSDEDVGLEKRFNAFQRRYGPVNHILEHNNKAPEQRVWQSRDDDVPSAAEDKMMQDDGLEKRFNAFQRRYGSVNHILEQNNKPAQARVWDAQDDNDDVTFIAEDKIVHDDGVGKQKVLGSDFGSGWGFGLGNIKWRRSDEGSSKAQTWSQEDISTAKARPMTQRGWTDETMGDDDEFI